MNRPGGAPVRASAALIVFIGVVLSMAAWLGLAAWMLPDVPRYRLELSGGAMPEGEERHQLSVGPDDFITIVLRPEIGTVGPIQVSGYHAPPLAEGTLADWRVDFAQLDGKTLALRGPVRDLLGTAPGRHRLRLVLGRPWWPTCGTSGTETFDAIHEPHAFDACQTSLQVLDGEVRIEP